MAPDKVTPCQLLSELPLSFIFGNIMEFSHLHSHQIICTCLRYSAFWPIYCTRVLYIEPVLIRSDIRLIQDYCGFGTCMLGQKNDIRMHFFHYNCGGAPTNQTIKVFIEDKAKEWSNRDLTLLAAFGTFVGHPGGVKRVRPCDPLITSNILWPIYYIQYFSYWINISSGELLQSNSCSENHLHNYYEISRS